MRKPAGKQGYATFTQRLRLQSSFRVGGRLPPTRFCVNFVYAWFSHGLRMATRERNRLKLGLRMVYAGLRMVCAWFAHGLRKV